RGWRNYKRFAVTDVGQEHRARLCAAANVGNWHNDLGGDPGQQVQGESCSDAVLQAAKNGRGITGYEDRVDTTVANGSAHDVGLIKGASYGVSSRVSLHEAARMDRREGRHRHDWDHRLRAARARRCSVCGIAEGWREG